MPLTKKHLESNVIWKTAIKRGQLVYAMRQVHDLSVAGVTKGSADDTDYSSGQGICMGISIQWLRLRKHHKDYPHKSQICNEVSLLTLRIQQAKFTSISQTIKDRGLHIVEEHENKVWDKLPLLGESLCLLSSAGHAMGIQIKKGAFHFFDPNYGHFKFKSRGKFKRLVTAIMTVGGRYKSPYSLHRVF